MISVEQPVEGHQIFAPLDAATESALRSSIKRHGVLVPIIVDQHGQIIDGHHRQRIASELGVEYRVDEMVVESDDHARELAETLNCDRGVRLRPEKRREVVADLRSEGHSYRAIGKALGVSHKTAIKDMQGGTPVPPATPEPERTIGTDGKSYPSVKRMTPEREERMKRTAEMRSEGKTYAVIAKELGIHESSARKAAYDSGASTPRKRRQCDSPHELLTRILDQLAVISEAERTWDFSAVTPTNEEARELDMGIRALKRIRQTIQGGN